MRKVRRTLLIAGLLAFSAAGAAAQQPAVLTGHVTSEDGTPLPNANVQVSSLNLSTTSRIDGHYSLLIPGNRFQPGQTVTVTVRAINFKQDSATVTLAEGEVTHDFTLATNPLQLGEIVVTGAGTTSEVEKLGSVRNNVDSTLIRQSNEENLVNALAAKAPNVTVISTAGDPGASASIQIRGANTLNSASEPLFVVDGVPINNMNVTTSTYDGTGFGNQQGTYAGNRAIDLNSADIQSVEILKGASAGAIYGARAGQGVILVTTKKGQPGPTTYSFRTAFSVNNVTRFPELQQSFGQGVGGQAETCVPGGDVNCTGTTRSWGIPIPAGTPTYDHTKEVFQTGFTTENNLTIAGGNDRTSFYLSGSAFYQDGTFVGPNNDFTRYTFRLRGDQALGTKWRLGGNVGYSYDQGSSLQKTSNFSGVLLGSWRATPTFDNRQYLDPINGMHRSYAFPNPSANSGNKSRGYDNPFFTANAPVSTTTVNRVIGNINLDFAATSWLDFAYILGVDYSDDERLQGQPQASSNTPLPTGQVIELSIGNTILESNFLGTANFKINPKVLGSVTLGQEFNSQSFSLVGGTGNGLLAPTPFSLRNTQSQNPPIDSVAQVNILGFFGQATFDLWEQLYLKGGLRYDGASTFGQDNLWAWFPSASGAWQFTKVTGTLGGNLTYGKLRAAYGQTGTPPPPYLGSNTFIAGGSFFDPFGPALSGSQGGQGGLFSPLVRPAANLEPERTSEIEAGVDLGLFKDIADLSFTWYQRTTNNVILQVPVAASTGYEFESANAAKIQNTGTEWTLNIRPITKRNFAWNLGFIFGTNRNHVLDLQGADFVSYGGLGGFGVSVADVGGSIGDFLDYDYVRCGRHIKLIKTQSGGTYYVDKNCTGQQKQEQAIFMPDQKRAKLNGGIALGYPLLDPTKRIIGSPDPDWTGSFLTGFRIGRFNISGLLDVRQGGLIYNGTQGALVALGTAKVTEQRGAPAVIGTFLDQPVAGPGATTTVPLSEKFFRNYYSTFALLGQPFYEDGSYVKLREISVGYLWTSRFVTQTLRLSSVQFTVAGRNLVTWTSYTGIDPETSFAGAESGTRGVDWFNNPQAMSFVFALTINK